MVAIPGLPVAANKPSTEANPKSARVEQGPHQDDLPTVAHSSKLAQFAVELINRFPNRRIGIETPEVSLIEHPFRVRQFQRNDLVAWKIALRGARRDH